MLYRAIGFSRILPTLGLQFGRVARFANEDSGVRADIIMHEADQLRP